MNIGESKGSCRVIRTDTYSLSMQEYSSKKFSLSSIKFLMIYSNSKMKLDLGDILRLGEIFINLG
jgi:hypothetical protein